MKYEHCALYGDRCNSAGQSGVQAQLGPTDVEVRLNWQLSDAVDDVAVIAWNDWC